METLLPLVPAALIPLIPNDVLRYVALVITIVPLVGRLIYYASPSSQVAVLEDTIKNLEEIFAMATKECARNPLFVHEVALKLAELKYTVSSLRTRMINTHDILWKRYPHHMWKLVLSITQCRSEMKMLRSSIQLELEIARQQKYTEDIHNKKASLEQIFSWGRRSGLGGPLRE